MTGRDLFSYEPAHARSTDPHTSHMAARKVDTNRLETQVLATLKLHGPMTTHEISDKSGIGLWSLSPRMKPLEAKGCVERKGTKTTVGPSGRSRTMIVWAAVG